MSEDEARFISTNGAPVFTWPPSMGIEELAAHVIERLGTKVYVSVDLDVLDPSIMSAVGTPEPGGMTWSEATKLLRLVSESRRIVGLDVVELSPNEGPGACAFTPPSSSTSSSVTPRRLTGRSGEGGRSKRASSAVEKLLTASG